MSEVRKKYDLIIAGAGLAGLSLLWQIRQAGFVDLQFLLIDQDEKRSNDRTWCFWEDQPGPFEHLVYRRWDHVRVTSSSGEVLTIPLRSYQYKMIRGIDLYTFMNDQIQADPQTTRLHASVQTVDPMDGAVRIQTDGGDFIGETLFDSTHRMPLSDPNAIHLLQHFLGYVIRTSEPVFDPSSPELMNFQVPDSGDCRFIYILPLSETEALVEYTLFTEALLSKEAYEAGLTSWIQTHLGSTDYQILEREFGVIPMSDEPVEEFPFSNVIRIGTAGGYTNPATGYTFRTTQKRIAQLIAHYTTTGEWKPDAPLREPRFNFYASALLGVLNQRRIPAAKVFWELYRRNPIDRIFRFLDGESNLQEEIRIMRSSPYLPFTAAGVKVLTNRIRRYLA